MELDKVIVVKIGGATLGSHDTTIEDVVYLQRQGKTLVVVHGGGKLLTEWLSRQEIPTRFVRGERVTDKATLEVATAVLAGLVNKEITAAINSRGGRAIGISGVDGAVIQGKVKKKELGYVGTVVKVNTAPLATLLESGYIPIISPMSLNPSDKTKGAPQILNINADHVAGEIAAAVGAERLILLTDVAGISDRTGRLLPELTTEEAEALMEAGVASGGMIPKIQACLRALATTPSTSIIDGRQEHALLKEMEGRGGGTTIIKTAGN
ncbi:MAG: acetylglutamate kinase [Dehalococcoidales bacterium]